MAMEVRYAGEFLSRKSITWRVEILQESTAPFDEVGPLTFDADQALQFEWESEKTDTVLGCTATLKIQSPSDRAYIDLYTVAVGQIRMDVYREGVLYWRGTLDPEFYEEPYERLDQYTVTLTFNDFGILDRLAFTREASGMSDLQDLVQECLTRAGLEYSDWDNDILEYSNTSFTQTAASANLSYLSVRNANFYDEEGEANTMEEVLEGILKPLGQRIMQHNGKIYIYDFDGLYEKGNHAEIVWSSDTQTLGVDSTYNNIIITFSPYAQNIEMPEDCWTEEIDEELCPYTMTSGYDYGECVVFGYDYLDGCLTTSTTEGDDESGSNGPGFSLWTSFNGANATVYHTGTYYGGYESAARFFKVVPFYRGEECEGIIFRWVTTGLEESDKGDTYTFSQKGVYDLLFSAAWSYALTGAVRDDLLVDFPEVDVPLLNNPEDFALCLSMDLQIAATTTPWHDKEPVIDYGFFSDFSWGSRYTSESSALKGTINYVLIPVDILFVTDDGDIYVWQNMEKDYPDIDYRFYYNWKQSLGTWVKRETGTTLHQSYISYYNTTSPSENGADCFGSWGTNHHFAGLSPSALVQATKIEGQCLAYPDVGKAGKITFAIRAGWLFLSYTPNVFRDFNYYSGDDGHFTLDFMHWVMAKMPNIEIVSSQAYNIDLNTDDVEYQGVINEDAKDDLEIDTICGTAGGIRPTARGGYYRTSTGEQLEQFWRAGAGGPIEELLINSYYSQFAERHTTLEGEAYLDEGFHIYTEPNQGNTIFLATTITEDVIADTANMKIIELSPDEYEPTED